MSVPAVRVSAVNEAPLREGGRYVLYWMIANRRLSWNHALDRAIEHAKRLDRPLLVFEALRSDYPFASDRLHRFILQGMADNLEAAKGQVTYYPYVERKRGEGKGLLAALAKEACVVVTDDFPCFFLPRMVAAAGRRLPVLLEQVDANGLLPMRAAPRVFLTAYAFRAFLQKNLAEHLAAPPKSNPFSRLSLPPCRLPPGVRERWPAADAALLKAPPEVLKALPIDHTVPPSSFDGGSVAAQRRLALFVKSKLAKYPELRNEPEEDGTSRLSPYLHFGHLSVHQVFGAVTREEGWSLTKLGKSAGGKRHGYWKLSEAAEGFLDELITWRELGFNFCSKREDYDQYESLPTWARQSLEQHEKDERPHLATPRALREGRTHDALWNAAQRQLVQDGWFHNYLRMLWGKKLLEYSKSPKDALATMVELMGRYSLDGRNPNSFTGFFWVLGRYDRPWGPERPIFGKVRYMSSENTARKVHVKDFIQRYAPD